MRRTEEEQFRDSAKPRDGPKSWFSEPPTRNYAALKRSRKRRKQMILSLLLLAAIVLVLGLLGFAR